MRQRGDARDVDDERGRVADRLDIDQASAGERRLDGQQVGGIDVLEPDAEAGEDPVEQLAGAAVTARAATTRSPARSVAASAAWMAAMPEPKAAGLGPRSAMAAAMAAAVGLSRRA
jgi:hypothetical protein